MGEHRCKPGRKTVDRRCTWHSEHFWCKDCEGYYGVAHDGECHTARKGRGGVINGHPSPACACRWCVERYRTAKEA